MCLMVAVSHHLHVVVSFLLLILPIDSHVTQNNNILPPPSHDRHKRQVTD